MLIYCYRQKGTEALNQKLSERLLRRALADYCRRRELGVTESEAESLALVREDGDKPYFPDLPQVYFSVSHSFSVWACAFSDEPVGLDLEMPALRWQKGADGGAEKAARQRDALARRYFTEEEQAYAKEGGADGFFRIWVRKEAYLKYTGQGISGGLGSINLVKDGQLLETANGVYFAELDLGPDVIAAVCSWKNCLGEPLLTVFSQSHAPGDLREYRPVAT